jgi:hypothetical protein
MVVLGATALIMVSASVYVDATRLSFDRQAMTHHRSQAREAAFAGVEWARLDHALSGRASGRGQIAMAGPAEVTVSYAAGPEALDVTVTSRAREVVETLRAHLERKDGELLLIDYRFGN